MPNRDIRFGPYAPPSVDIGDDILDAMRGVLRVHSWSDRGAIMWPLGIRDSAHPGRPALVLSGDLVRAVQREAAIAVARHWRTTWRTVRVWRRALSVGRMTEGSDRLAAELGRPEIALESARGNAASLLPASRRRRDLAHAAAMKGRKPSPETAAGARERWQRMTPAEREAQKQRLIRARWPR